MSRHGKHSKLYRDKVQMMGIIDGGIEINNDGSRQLKEKTWDTTNNIYAKNKQKRKLFIPPEPNQWDSSDEEDLVANDNVTRCRRYHKT